MKDTVTISDLPDLAHVRSWKIEQYRKIMSALGRGRLGWEWITEIEQPGMTVDKLGRDDPNTQAMEDKISASTIEMCNTLKARKHLDAFRRNLVIELT